MTNQDQTITPNEERMNHIIDNLAMADIIRVDGGPLLTQFEQEEDGAIGFTWTDGEDEHSEHVNAEEVAQAQVTDNTLVMTNILNETIRVELFNLTNHNVIFPVKHHATEAFIHEHTKDDPALEQVLIESLDDAVMDAIGGYRASTINNQGPTYQIEELASHGYDYLAIKVLSEVLMVDQGIVASAIRSHELSPAA